MKIDWTVTVVRNLKKNGEKLRLRHEFCAKKNRECAKGTVGMFSDPKRRLFKLEFFCQRLFAKLDCSTNLNAAKQHYEKMKLIILTNRTILSREEKFSRCSMTTSDQPTTAGLWILFHVSVDQMYELKCIRNNDASQVS